MKWPRYTPYATEIHTEYVLQLRRAGYVSLPVASTRDTIKTNQLTSALETTAMALSPKSYLADLKVLQEIKDLRGWEDDDPQWVRMLKGLDKRAAGKLPAPNPLGDSAPKVKALFDWNTVGSKKYASWLKSEAGLKDIYDGDWKPDPNSRGGLVTFKKEKCPWKRRIAKEKAHLVRPTLTISGIRAPSSCGKSPSRASQHGSIGLSSALGG